MASQQQAAIAALPDSPKVPLAVLEDRYRGLLANPWSVTKAGERLVMAGDYNGFQLKLDITLRRLLEGTARAELPEDDGSVDEILTLLRETVISFVDSRGLAR